ncbi:MAG TPA: hypothetical protein VGL07_13325 [Buttiauxella sp.]
MIRALMGIPEIVVEDGGCYEWNLMAAGLHGRFLICEESVGMLFLQLADSVLSVKLVEHWHYQFSNGEFATRMALAFQNNCWWLVQRFECTEALRSAVCLQIQLAECIQAIARSDAQPSVLNWGRA